VTELARTRIVWVDYAKGLGIFLVVFAHVLRGLRSSHIVNDGAVFQFVDAWIYSFHMPLFFLLSGLFADRLIKRSVGVLVRDRFATLAYPYLVWSMLQSITQFALWRYTNHSSSLDAIAGILIKPTMQFWFLYALFLISLSYYVLRRCGLGPLGALAVFIIFWASQTWVSVGEWSPLLAMRNFGLYFALGPVLSRYGYVERFERAPAPLLVLTALLGYGVVAAWTARFGAAVPLLALAITLCGIAATIALAVLIGQTSGMGLVRILGVYSLEIYVAHTFASAGIRIILQNFLSVHDTIVHIMLGTIGGLALPLLLSWICQRYQASFLFRLPKRATPSVHYQAS
jgi:fucose 4-O-acetylase-like acetyltransferase